MDAWTQIADQIDWGDFAKNGKNEFGLLNAFKDRWAERFLQGNFLYLSK